MAITLKKEVILDRWSTLVNNGQGKMDQVYTDTENNIKKSEPPKVEFERVNITPSLIGGFLGKERLYIRVINEDLPGYNIYIGVRDYGKNLDCSGYMTYQASLLERIINKLLGWLTKKTLVPTLDLFEEQDLRA